MGKKKGGHSQQKNQKKKQPKRPSPEELERQRQIAEFDTKSNAYTTVVFKRIRNINKRLTKIQSYKEKDSSELNEDQNRAVADEPNLLRLREQLQSIQAELVTIALKEAESNTQVMEASATPEQPIYDEPTPFVEETIKQSAT